MTLQHHLQLHQTEPWTKAAFKSDLNPSDTKRMDAGASVVIAPVRLVLDLDAHGFDLRFQAAPLS